MRIAIFTDTFTPQVNGVARTFQRFVDYLEDQNIEYRLFVPETEEDLYSSQIHRFTSLPFYLYPECRLAFPNVFHIKRELEQFNPDIIHIATPFNMGLTGLFYGRKLNIPMVGSYHTNFDQYLRYYDLQFLSKWIWKYMNWFHRSFDINFVPSYETKKDVEGKGFSNVHIWSRGVDCNKFHPQFSREDFRERYKIKERYILSFVGRLAPEKDVDVLVKIAEQLPSYLKENVHWIVAGDGPLLEELQNNKIRNMTLTGYLKGNQLAELYAVSNLFVFPSSTETFGNVVLESLACGTPVIGAKAGGVQEIIQHHKTGILCEPGNVSEFVSSIEELLHKTKVLEEMGVEARNYALRKTWDSIFKQLLYHYENVIHINQLNHKVSNL
ncbi:glycosyltransferase family 1 protein [Bacillus sp. BGMRC 2118]|nr:glycosyltransferase family 1 protein [Bacillus sp. BGMRC 2118]